jgi:hypothetical protein
MTPEEKKRLEERQEREAAAVALAFWEITAFVALMSFFGFAAGGIALFVYAALCVHPYLRLRMRIINQSVKRKEPRP